MTKPRRERGVRTSKPIVRARRLRFAASFIVRLRVCQFFPSLPSRLPRFFRRPRPSPSRYPNLFAALGVPLSLALSLGETHTCTRSLFLPRRLLSALLVGPDAFLSINDPRSLSERPTRATRIERHAHNRHTRIEVGSSISLSLPPVPFPSSSSCEATERSSDGLKTVLMSIVSAFDVTGNCFIVTRRGLVGGMEIF